MKNTLTKFFFVFVAISILSCNSPNKEKIDKADKSFANFETNFLDSYWKQYPSGSINAGYGKYYDKLIVPNSATFADNVDFSNKYLAELNAIPFDKLSDNNKISCNIIKNQLESDIWYTTVFKQQEWDASVYNISSSCDYIINQPYAPLDNRLIILSHYLENSDAYYKAALENLKQPTKEHLELAIKQNTGGLGVFGKSLTYSITTSHLDSAVKDSLQKNIAKATTAMKDYVIGLKKMSADKNFKFKDYRIGKELFVEKFKYDLATDFTPEQIYKKALADKKFYHDKMYVTANKVWKNTIQHRRHQKTV